MNKKAKRLEEEIMDLREQVAIAEGELAKIPVGGSRSNSMRIKIRIMADEIEKKEREFMQEQGQKTIFPWEK